MGRGSRLLGVLQSPETAPRTIGTAMVIISSASAPKGRMPPTEKLKSLSSGNAAMTRRVKPAMTLPMSQQRVRCDERRRFRGHKTSRKLVPA